MVWARKVTKGVRLGERTSWHSDDPQKSKRTPRASASYPVAQSLYPFDFAGVRISGSNSQESQRLGVQAKLERAGGVEDALEQEAQATANRIVSARSDTGVQASSEGTGETATVRGRLPIPGLSPASSVVEDALASVGEPLDHADRAFMEPRFHHDFSSVRVHRDARADASARAVGALAYTVGDDIVFREGSFAPKTTAGKELLAHELTHVVQQAGTPVRGTRTGRGPSAAVIQRQAAEPTPTPLPSHGQIKKIEVSTAGRDGTGSATITLHFVDGTTKLIHGTAGGAKTPDGRVHKTTPGPHKIEEGKHKDHVSSTYRDKQGNPAKMPYYQPFGGGEGFHVGGSNLSHGCIHLEQTDAELIFNNAPVGTPVDIDVHKKEKPASVHVEPRRVRTDHAQGAH